MEANTLRRIFILFRSFFVISAITLGGGMAMLPAIQQEFVTKRNWFTGDDMVDTVAAVQSMPGVIAANMATLIGFRIAGVWGAVAAVVGATLPPFVSIALLAHIIERLREYQAVQHVFLGVRASLAALILLSVFSLAKKLFASCKERLKIMSAVIITCSFFATLFVNAVWVVIAAASLGLLTTWVLGEEKKQTANGEAGK